MADDQEKQEQLPSWVGNKCGPSVNVKEELSEDHEAWLSDDYKGWGAEYTRETIITFERGVLTQKKRFDCNYRAVELIYNDSYTLNMGIHESGKLMIYIRFQKFDDDFSDNVNDVLKPELESLSIEAVLMGLQREFPLGPFARRATSGGAT